MKNSASNSLIKQALQAQSEQLLPVVTHVLSDRQYSNITHQRISQQQIEKRTEQAKANNQQTNKQSYYQGLTRAQHLQYGSVMIKWELCAALESLQNVSALNREISVLQALCMSQKIQSTTITPAVLACYDVEIHVSGQSQRLTVLVMPYYENGSLANLLSQHSALTNKQKHDLIKGSAYLVCNLHKSGWLHNDIKPSNILLSEVSTASADMNRIIYDLLLTDFSLAGTYHQPNATNATGGTPAYLAPERWQGQRATVQSDIYAFGIMMAEILTGTRPFQIAAQSVDPMIDWAIQHCQQPILKLPIAYARYQCIVDIALAKRVEKRYQNMDMVLAALKRLS